MLVKFLKDTEVNDRKYLAGETRELEEVVARQLIEDGSAKEPTIEKVLRDGAPKSAKENKLKKVK